MSRSALIVSLALHAGLIGLMGLIARWPLATTHGDSGKTEVAVSFLPGDEAESLLLEAAPAPLHYSPASMPVQPEFRPMPAAEAIVPVVRALTGAGFRLPADIAPAQTMPAARFDIARAKSGRVAIRAAAHFGRSLNGRRGLPGGAANGKLGGAGPGLGNGGYVPPQFRLRYKPPYPAAARVERLEGTVLLLVSVDSAGKVARAEIHHTSGYPVLDRAALNAVRSWRFEPARQDGVATAGQVEVPVRFRFG